MTNQKKETRVATCLFSRIFWDSLRAKGRPIIRFFKWLTTSRHCQQKIKLCLVIYPVYFVVYMDLRVPKPYWCPDRETCFFFQGHPNRCFKPHSLFFPFINLLFALFKPPLFVVISWKNLVPFSQPISSVRKLSQSEAKLGPMVIC